MKNILTTILGLLLVCSCGSKNKEQAQQHEFTIETTNQSEKHAATESLKSKVQSGVIYEANIRQYSPSGTFNAFTKDIPTLKELGVKVIWLMPVYPISTTNSKGSLGSYYAISDYTSINKEFGTLKDFRSLVNTAHQNDMIVILDWVANHTGWDHLWINEHPEFYTKNNDGEIIPPKNTDWSDVADLNYDNFEMRKEMLKAMKYWVEKENIDGFRCDVAAMVPTDFWENTIAELRKIKPLFMLAEAWEPELMEKAFDMGYSWDTFHLLNDIAQQKAKPKKLEERLSQIDTLYAVDDILMNFVTNHDENSWNGYVKERMGEASEAMMALTYVVPGMPLIYSGQEYDLNKRLKFFDKDSIAKIKGKSWYLLKKLGDLKNNHPTLNSTLSKNYKWISTNNENALSFKRFTKKDTLVYLANFSNNTISISSEIQGKYYDILEENTPVELNSNHTIKLQPWEFKIYVNKVVN